jgi:hypothetical protein
MNASPGGNGRRERTPAAEEDLLQPIFVLSCNQ